MKKIQLLPFKMLHSLRKVICFSILISESYNNVNGPASRFPVLNGFMITSDCFSEGPYLLGSDEAE